MGVKAMLPRLTRMNISIYYQAAVDCCQLSVAITKAIPNH